MQNEYPLVRVTEVPPTDHRLAFLAIPVSCGSAINLRVRPSKPLYSPTVTYFPSYKLSLPLPPLNLRLDSSLPCRPGFSLVHPPLLSNKRFRRREILPSSPPSRIPPMNSGPFEDVLNDPVVYWPRPTNVICGLNASFVASASRRRGGIGTTHVERRDVDILDARVNIPTAHSRVRSQCAVSAGTWRAVKARPHS